MKSGVVIERRGRIAVVKVDNPPVNALSHPVRLGLCAGLQAAAAEADVILVTGVRGRFVVGADIKELDQEIAPPDLLDIERVIASVRPPVVAVVEGDVLGGGLLLALMCDMRVSTAGAKFGYPEVALGLLPTFAGTQLTPRLCGAVFALDWMSSGTTLNAEDARARGLVDGVLSTADLAASGDLIAAAEAWLTQKASPAKRRALNLPWPEEPIAPLQALRDEVSKAAPGFLAPVCIAEAVLNGFEMGLEKALEQEARLFAELRGSDQSKALRRLFFAERAAGKEARSMSGYPWSPGLMSEVGWCEVVVEESGQSLTRAQGAAWLSRSVVVRGRSAACALADALEGELQAIHADPRDQAELLRSIGFSRGATAFWTGADADVTAIDEEKYARLRRGLSAAGDALLRAGVVSEPERLNVVMAAALGWPRFRADLF